MVPSFAADTHLVVQAIGAIAASWCFLHLVRRFTQTSPLDKIPGPPSPSYFLGNLDEFFCHDSWDFHTRLIQDYGSIVKLHGLFNEPLLYVFDPQGLQQLLVRDVASFEQAEESLALFDFMLGPGMTSATGDAHRRQRKMMTPAFSPTHLRQITPIFFKVANQLRDAMVSRLTKGESEIDMLHWLPRVALELIGQGGLGYSFDPLVEDTGDEFGDRVKEIVPLTLELPVLRQILPLLRRWGPSWFPRWFVSLIPHATTQRFLGLSNYLVRRSAEIYESKKAALREGEDAVVRQVGEGRDIMSILMRANMAATGSDRLPEREVIGEMTVMTVAGTDTTANSIARMLHRLAELPNVQDTLRREIVEAQCDGNISFEKLIQLPYLNAVCRETLRVDAPGPFAVRNCIKDTVIPLSRPVHGIDGSLMKEITVPRGTKVFLGILGSNLNRDVWGEDALEWKPERWLGPLPIAVSDIPGVYANLMTFTGGPRSCIGFKFAELEMKVVLSVLLSHFKFELTDKMITWNVAQVCYPTTDPGSKVGQLPLRVSVIQDQPLS